jgi:hypothetical protein
MGIDWTKAKKHKPLPTDKGRCPWLLPPAFRAVSTCIILVKTTKSYGISTKGAPASGQGNALSIWAVHRICPEGAKANALMNG